MKPSHHEVRFRSRARLVSVLGEHLISDQAVGLIELVKNSYDADATDVTVEVLGIADPKRTTVIVRDNGSGMTLSDIENKWLVPAVDDKEKAKLRGERSPLGRLPIGEKGVGRFAAHQIAHRLELVTRPKGGAQEIELVVDWDRFDQTSDYLDSVSLDVIERDPELFPGSGHGTRLTMRGARGAWTVRLVEKVQRTLRRLQNPLPDDRAGFRVHLNCPEYPEYENVDPTEILDRAHYSFRASVSPNGECDFTYDCRHPAIKARTVSGTQDLRELAAGELREREPQSGPFWLNLYVWDRSREYLHTSGVSARELDAQSGVSLYRDGLRVLPYGEPGDDWLLLDQERIQAPADRIGNNQVIGLVMVDQGQNLLLRDKTNREGLIENAAFLDLRAFVRAAMKVFTTYWRKDRPRQERPKEIRDGSIKVAQQVASAIKESARADITVRLPGEVGDDSQDGSHNENSAAPARLSVSQVAAVDLLIEELSAAETSVRTREERAAVLLHLAATGLAAERVVHEFGRQVSAANRAIAAIRSRVDQTEKGQQSLKILETAMHTLRNEFRVLSPYETAERLQRRSSVSVRDSAELALELNRTQLSAGAITAEVLGTDFNLRVRAASLVQVLDNLVNNSAHWLSTLRQTQVRRLAIVLVPNDRRIIVADSGPGFAAEAIQHAFTPFFTMKADGKGLGLYISRELMSGMKGSIRIVSRAEGSSIPAWASGAAFELDFGRAAALRREDASDGEAEEQSHKPQKHRVQAVGVPSRKHGQRGTC
jgi:C4-dicarboxylate-specific signal transduction histidine kinase